MQKINLHFGIWLLVIFLAGCARPRVVKLPPVTEGWHKSTAVRSAYLVQPHDTLYSIAWAFGLDYRELVAINQLTPPYLLRSGQRLYLVSPTKLAKGKRKSASLHKPLHGWVWPTADGKAVARFNNKLGGNKGIDIAGSYNQSVLACNRGTVVYSGTGLRSYGKLIIIKHSDDYLSAYAYNQQMLVTEGQEVTTGQKIALMGRNNEGKIMLHFEIRRFGQPVDPLLYLPKKL